ncbi:ABC transporter thiamine pyrophosphate-binding lipoprotein p37/Cypl [Mycoplasma hafezii]|uniref:ABC transporter thiamine pyrophosphate-binding lipoprotein p37/Cypl n=1 Tax=Mycoplasma hafezii TaxID=525886 RepID=UPI003CE70146
MLKRKLITLLGAISVCATPMVALSCNDTNSKTEYILQLQAPYGNPEQIKQELTQYLNNFLAQKGSNKTVKINFVDGDDYSQVKDSLDKNEIDFGMVSSGSIAQYKTDVQNKKLHIVMQTLTKQFEGEQANAWYKNDQGIELQNIATKEQELYDKYPRNQWNNENNPLGWNGSIYQAFYNDNLVNHQRGLFVIVATPTITEQIRKAWNEKDLKKFISFGLGVGSIKSGSKYLLPQALMQKQFGEQFKSFRDLTAKYPNNISNTEIKKLNDVKTENIHIFMANEGFYAYSKVKEPDKYTPTGYREGQKLSFLTLTDPLPYNVGIASDKMDLADAKIIVDAFSKLAQENKDPWGPLHGFNGYKYIDNVDTEFWQKVYEALNIK